MERHSQCFSNVAGINPLRGGIVVEFVFFRVPELDIFAKTRFLLFGEINNRNFDFDERCFGAFCFLTFDGYSGCGLLHTRY